MLFMVYSVITPNALFKIVFNNFYTCFTIWIPYWFWIQPRVIYLKYCSKHEFSNFWEFSQPQAIFYRYSWPDKLCHMKNVFEIKMIGSIEKRFMLKPSCNLSKSFYSIQSFGYFLESFLNLFRVVLNLSEFRKDLNPNNNLSQIRVSVGLLKTACFGTWGT